MMGLFVKNVHSEMALTIFAKGFVVDVWGGLNALMPGYNKKVTHT